MANDLFSVTGASGGLGASTFAAVLALAVAKATGPTVLIDLDLVSGGLDVTCGVDHLSGLRWPDLAGVVGSVERKALHAALPRHADCAVLSAAPSRTNPSAPRPSAVAVGDVLASVSRVGPTVLDLPRIAVGQWGIRPDRWFVLTGTRARDLADLDACIDRIVAFAGTADTSRIAVVTTGPEPEQRLVAAIEAHLGVGHVGHIARDSGVRAAAERGQWPRGRVFGSVLGEAQDWMWRRGVGGAA